MNSNCGDSLLTRCMHAQETEFREPARQFEDAEIDQLGLRYYTTDVHRAAFTLPRFAAKALNP